MEKDNKKFLIEIKEHLTKDLILFWENLKDTENGGYYGYMDYNLNINKTFEKGCILNSRILWFFSSAYELLNISSLLDNAKHSFEFLKNHCIDKKNGGVYWAVDYKGNVLDSTKHTYNQAFAIYALSAYYKITKDEEALKLANELYNIIETKCKDEQGYLEAFTIDFKPKSNEKLSENGVLAEKTMNTLLHIFEAYTEFYNVTKKQEVADNLKFMLDIFTDKVYNEKLGRQEVFFDKNWNSLIDLYSYGHDIETAWLIDKGLEILNDKEYTNKISKITEEIAKNIYDRAYVENSLYNEAENGIVDKTRVWWVQAETLVGFLNAWQKNKENEHYIKAVQDIWEYIKKYIIDKRQNSEWFWALDENHKPLEKPIVEPWKCPYHNGRMCIEVIRRLENDT